MPPGFSVERLSEDALLLRFGDCIDAAINMRVQAAARALRAAALPGVVDVAPAYASLLVRLDAAVWNVANTGPTRLRRLLDIVRDCPDTANTESPGPGLRRDDEPGKTHSASIGTTMVEIPVCYGGEFGPDLEVVAAHAKLVPQEVVARHLAGAYTVAMLGFAPGFPYLLGLDPVLHTPRRTTPRTRVPVGAVAIGGAQTGIYPSELPGGWNLIGRTPLALFDPRRDPACLLAPGDRIRFRALDQAGFAAAAGSRG